MHDLPEPVTPNPKSLSDRITPGLRVRGQCDAKIFFSNFIQAAPSGRELRRAVYAGINRGLGDARS